LYVEYTVPSGQTVRVWEGGTASQKASDALPDDVAQPVLPGRGQQIWMPRGTLTPSEPKPTGW
jgi:hypothetical protein